MDFTFFKYFVSKIGTLFNLLTDKIQIYSSIFWLIIFKFKFSQSENRIKIKWHKKDKGKRLWLALWELVISHLPFFLSCDYVKRKINTKFIRKFYKLKIDSNPFKLQKSNKKIENWTKRKL